ncbi:hypothetical protein N7520_008546 [Penicillium odoratum]|uniref:uncharacterized protein n=1 Tax=Penicillium odoratum TaxID=1167516 RepID=UPI002547AC74|nr:uncharacterized protein N7520_008546 [Penicillium odoratum]KAJ5751629.1 hypothetical protein N7520_008546 [Penicillium odoratum]
MAEDSRDSASVQEAGSHLPASTPNTDPTKPKHDFPQSQVGKLWDAFGNPEEPVNMLANASYKPRGKNPKDVSYSEVVGDVSMSEISSFYKAPCARESLLTGIGAGFGIGGIRGVFGGMRSLWSAGNWAVGAFAITSLAAYEFCRRQRIEEMHGMKQAVELMKELKDKKQRDKEKAMEAAAQRAEEERQKKSWTNPSNYKFW